MDTFGWTSDERESYLVLDAFVAGGGNFIDTPDSHTAHVPDNSGGESESIIGSWLAARGTGDSLVIGTKVSQHPAFKGLAVGTVTVALEASLVRLGTDHIDVYYAHFDDPKTPLAETAGVFDALHEPGKIRVVALSNYTAPRIKEWLDIARREGCAGRFWSETGAEVRSCRQGTSRTSTFKVVKRHLSGEGVGCVDPIWARSDRDGGYTVLGCFDRSS